MTIRKICSWTMLLCMVMNIIACSDDEEAAQQLDLVGGCWVCAQNEYNDMLEFTADGAVTSNGVQGNDTWGLEGTYLFAGNTLTMDFGSNKREGSVKVLDEDTFIYTDGTGAKSYDRRYPPTFEEALGWTWDWATTIFVQQTLKNEFTTPEYEESDGTMTTVTFTVDELKTLLDNLIKRYFKQAKFTENAFVLPQMNVKAVSMVDTFPYMNLGEGVVSIAFDSPEPSFQIAAQVMFFANGKMVMYFVGGQAYKLVNWLLYRNTGLMFNQELMDKALAETYSQLVLCVSFNLSE